MKKPIILTLFIFYFITLKSQTPFKVDKVYNIYNSDTIETHDFMWDEIGIKILNGKVHGDVKIY